jgi:hypothetical protein
MTTTWQPVTVLRRTIETHILDLYDHSSGLLRPASAWPGSYQLPDGSRVPAVYVVGPTMVPSNWTIQGIETTIEAVPEIESPGSVGGVISLETWTIRFTNYGTREGTAMPVTLQDICRRLARAFPRDRVTYMARTEATYEAATARIRGAVLNPPIP